jgi:hypothetical protein
MRRFAIAALALVLTGCLSETTAPSAADLSGTWSIVNINDQPLPYTFPNGATLTGGQMVLQVNGAYTSVEHYVGAADYTEDGAYTIYGRDLMFTDALRGQQFGATWDAGTISKSAGNYHFIYRKQ